MSAAITTDSTRSGPQPRRHLSVWLPWLIFALSAAMTVGVFLHLQRQEGIDRKASIARETALISAEIRERLRNQAQFLRGVRAFVAASDDVTPAEWRTFSAQFELERNIAGIQAYGYAPIRRTTRNEPVGYPIQYFSPDTPLNRPTLGFNLASEARREEAVRHAIERNDVSLSRRIELIQDFGNNEPQAGLVMILPVYQPGKPINTPAERRAAAKGIVYAAYRMSDFMAALNYSNSGSLGLRIFDEESFNTDATEQSLTLLFDSSSAGSPIDERELEFAQRNWHLQYFDGSQSGLSNEPLFFLVTGLIVSILLGFISRLQVSARQRAEVLAADMTQELKLSEERFKLAAAGTNDGIYDRNLVAGTVWHSARLRELAGFGPDVDTANVGFFISRIHPDDRALLDAALQKHFRERAPYRIEYRFQKGNGEWAWFRSNGQAVWNEKGEPVRLVGSITDITEQKRSQEALAQYRDFLSTVLRFIPHPVFVKNRQRQYIAVNEAFCRLIDRKEDEILGRVDLGRTPMPDEITAIIREADERVFAGLGEQIDEHELPLRRGLRTVISRKALATDPDGSPILIGTLTDITELRAAERAREEAATQLRAVLDAATQVSIIATDTSGLITLFNRGAEKMLGYGADEMIDRNTPAIIHLAEEVVARGEFLSAELGRPVAGFEVFIALPMLYGSEQREWTYVRKDGSHRRVTLGVTAVRDTAGVVTGFLGIATDITDREKAQAELARQHARMQTILEHIPGGVSLIDSELNFIAANEELKRVLEFPEELFASGAPSLYEVALFNARRGDYGPGKPEELAQAVVERSRNPTKHKFERTRPNGRTIEVSGTPLPDGGFVTIYTDITERKQAEAELVRHRDHLQELVEERTADLLSAKEAAERASEAKSEFLANMSHELRTPMHSILSFASLGEEKSTTAGQEKLLHFFHRIHQSGDRLLSLLNNLLDLSKLEAGMMQVDLKPENLLVTVREAVTESENWAAERRIRLEVTSSIEAPYVRIDHLRMGQVIRNLLSNAIKFSPDGGTIEICIDEAILPGRRATDLGSLAAISLTVRDQGVGVPEEEREAIFDKFVQSSKTKSGAGGTGLGLSICREIVRAHRGTIQAYNNPQEGASLIVVLPRFLPQTH